MVIGSAHRFIFNSRDDPADERLKILSGCEGVWRCRTIFNCTEACPREIRITKAFGEVKKAILKGSRDIPIPPNAPQPLVTGERRDARYTTGPVAMMPRGRCLLMNGASV
jgi:hypothetical protein